MASKKLDDRPARFVDEYLKDMNGTQAAIRAGYAPGGAHVSASRLLKNAKVIEALKRKQAKIAEKAQVTVEEIVEELKLLAFSRMSHFAKKDANGDPLFDLDKLEAAEGAAISELTLDTRREVGSGDEDASAAEVKRVKLKLYDKRGALVDLLKHLGGQFKAPVKSDGDEDGGADRIEIVGGLPEE